MTDAQIPDPPAKVAVSLKQLPSRWPFPEGLPRVRLQRVRVASDPEPEPEKKALRKLK